MTDDPSRPPRSLSGWALLACAFAVPVLGFLIAVVMWWAVNGVPDGGRGMGGGLLLFLGVAVIAAAWWAADRFWIGPRHPSK